MTSLQVERASPMLPTVYGNGPFQPVIVYKGTFYPVGAALDDMGDAIRAATSAAEDVRAMLRGEAPQGYHW